MICPVCKENNEKSTVRDYGGTSTLMGNPSYYDEDGVYHHHDTNNRRHNFECSNEHKFMTIRKGSPCPSYPDGCDYAGGDIEYKFE